MLLAISVAVAPAWHSDGARSLILAALAASFIPRLISVWKYRQSLYSALLHPLGVTVLLVLQWYAFLRKLAGQRVTWKERAYRWDDATVRSDKHFISYGKFRLLLAIFLAFSAVLQAADSFERDWLSARAIFSPTCRETVPQRTKLARALRLIARLPVIRWSMRTAAAWSFWTRPHVGDMG